MEEINSPDDVVSHFNQIDGIEAMESGTHHDALVKVTDESAMGSFFREVRVNDFDRSYTTRNCIEDCVLDSWVELNE